MPRFPRLHSLRRRLPRLALPLMGGAAALLALFVLTWQDDRPDPAIEALLEPRRALPQNDTPFYLMGFEAPADRDPLQFGRYRVDAYSLALVADPHPDERVAWRDPYELERYALPEGALFCQPLEPGCLAAVLAGGRQAAPLLREHAVLLARYRTLLALPEGCSCRIPADRRVELMFPASAVLRGGRLHNLAALHGAHGSDARRALRQLEDHVRQLRPHLAQTPDLAGKMVYQLLMAETVDLMAMLASRHPDTRLPLLAPLTPDELDLSRVLGGEYLELDDRLGYFERHPESLPGRGALLGGASRLAFKPAMTRNTLAHTLAASVAVSRKGAEQLVAALPALEPSPSPLLQRLRNPEGEALLAQGDFRYLEAIGRMHDLQAKLVLYNALAAGKGRVEWAGVRNPYYASPQAPVGAASQREVCFDGPLPDQFRLRCLAL